MTGTRNPVHSPDMHSSPLPALTLPTISKLYITEDHLTIKKTILVGGLLGVVVVLSARVAWTRLHPYHPFAQTVFADAPAAFDFHLTDQNDQPLSLAQLRGKVVLLTFGFARCPNICPVTLANLSWAYNVLTPEEKAEVQVLFVSVDPARDTPAHLRGYVPFYNPAFLGVTGTPDELARTAKAYGVFYAMDPPADPAKPGEYNVTHSAYVYLIDKQGRWRAMYNHDQLPERDKLAADLAHYAKE